MEETRVHTVRTVKAGIVTGLAAALFYPIWSFVPLPDRLEQLMVFAFGPLLVAAFLGIHRFLRLHRPTVSGDIGAVFGMIAGVSFSMMIIVQMSNLDYIRGYMADAPDEATVEMLRWILRGVFTVQLGLDIVWDIFICSATVLVAVAMIGHPRFGAFFVVPGVVLGAMTLVLNIYTFPAPPAEAGLIDLGPAVGAWFLVVVIQMARSVGWVKTAAGAGASGASMG